MVCATKSPTLIQAANLVVALDHGRAAFVGSPTGYAEWKVATTGEAAAATVIAEER